MSHEYKEVLVSQDDFTAGDRAILTRNGGNFPAVVLVTPSNEDSVRWQNLTLYTFEGRAAKRGEALTVDRETRRVWACLQ